MRIRIPLVLLHIVIVLALIAVPLSMVRAHTSANVVGSSIHATHGSPEPAVEHMDHAGDEVTGSNVSDCLAGMDSGSHHSGDSDNACCYGMCLADVIDAGKTSARDRVRSRFIREAPSAFKCADLITPQAPPRA